MAPMPRLGSYTVRACVRSFRNADLGPVPAAVPALEQTGWSIGVIDRAEINRAFAAIADALAREIGIEEDTVDG